MQALGAALQHFTFEFTALIKSTNWATKGLMLVPGAIVWPDHFLWDFSWAWLAGAVCSLVGGFESYLAMLQAVCVVL